MSNEAITVDAARLRVLAQQMRDAFENEDEEYGNDDFRDDLHDVLAGLESLL